MIRLGLIGCGGIAGVHMTSLNDFGDNMIVSATVDVDESKAIEAANALGVKKYATDIRDVFDDVDAVLLSLPHQLHHPVGMDCIAAGKHVLMEKPLANSEEECQDLIKASDDAGVVLMVAYPWPYHPLGVAMKQLLDEKTYGDVFHVSMWTEQFTDAPVGHWSSKAATLGGGQLFSHGCHYVDLLLRYLGNPIEGTHVGTNYGTPWMEWEGTSDVAIKFENGSIGYHFGTWGAKGSRLKYSFHAHCTEGMLEVRMATGELILHQGEEETVLLKTEFSKNLEKEMEHFIDCIKTGNKPVTDGRSSLQSLRVIWKLYEAEKKKIVADLRGLGVDQV